MDDLVILGATFAPLLAVALWELGLPRRIKEFPAMRRRLGNGGIWLTNILGAAFVFRHPETWRADIGVNLPAWPLEGLLSFVAAFLLLDLVRYALHRAKHAVPLFWRFHAPHHSDPDIDFSTALRQHPVDFFVSSGIMWAVIAAFDVPVAEWATYGLTLFTCEALQHGNVRVPAGLERLFRLAAIVGPNMHQVHHSVQFEQSNSNFGALLSIWDRLFGTFTVLPRSEVDGITFGVAELPRYWSAKPSGMLLTPWRLQRSRNDALPGEFARDPQVQRASFDIVEEIWRHRLNSLTEPSSFGRRHQ